MHKTKKLEKVKSPAHAGNRRLEPSNLGELTMSGRMKKQQLYYLFFANFAILFVGMGVFPILPLYAIEFGAKPSFIGIYLAITYLSITIGSMLTGYLSSKFGIKSLFIGSGIAGIPVLVLMGYVQSLWQVVFLTSIIWFVGGIGVGLAGVFTGYYAEKKDRGKSFSFQSLSSPVSAIIGGAIVGYILEVYSYQAMFIVSAIIWTIWPALGLWKIQYMAPVPQITPGKAKLEKKESLSKSFILILAITLLAALTVNASRLGLSISMESLNFSAAEVSSTTVAGGIASIPAILLIGSLTDRFGRSKSIALGLLLTVAGSIILVFATQLWHFWTASAFLLVSLATNGSVTSALITDMLPASELKNKLPLTNTMRYIASIISFGGAGYVLEMLGPDFLYGAAAVLPIAAVLLTIRLNTTNQGSLPGQQAVPKKARQTTMVSQEQPVPCQ